MRRARHGQHIEQHQAVVRQAHRVRRHARGLAVAAIRYQRGKLSRRALLRSRGWQQFDADHTHHEARIVESYFHMQRMSLADGRYWDREGQYLRPRWRRERIKIWHEGAYSATFLDVLVRQSVYQPVIRLVDNRRRSNSPQQPQQPQQLQQQLNSILRQSLHDALPTLRRSLATA